MHLFVVQRARPDPHFFFCLSLSLLCQLGSLTPGPSPFENMAFQDLTLQCVISINGKDISTNFDVIKNENIKIIANFKTMTISNSWINKNEKENEIKKLELRKENENRIQQQKILDLKHAISDQEIKAWNEFLDATTDRVIESFKLSTFNCSKAHLFPQASKYNSKFNFLSQHDHTLRNHIRTIIEYTIMFRVFKIKSNEGKEGFHIPSEYISKKISVRLTGIKTDSIIGQMEISFHANDQYSYNQSISFYGGEFYYYSQKGLFGSSRKNCRQDDNLFTLKFSDIPVPQNDNYIRNTYSDIRSEKVFKYEKKL
ncbi:MAG: hypothetical protein PF442_04145 [Desulfobulbaceae bacterium]|nr:hypothetical protein [Desulfobulbaceae bacterium]